MPRFQYEALDSRGKTVSGVVNAPSRDVVLRDLRSQRYTVTSIKEQGGAFEGGGDLTKRFQHVSVFDLAIFTRQFAVLFSSGMSMVRSLEALMIQGKGDKLSLTIETMAKDIKGGFSLSRTSPRAPAISPAFTRLT